MFWFLILIIVTICFLNYLWKNRQIYELSAKLKCDYISLPFLGHAYKFVGSNEDRMEVIKMFSLQALKHGGRSKAWLGNRLYTVLTDPVDIDIVMKTCMEKDEAMNIFKLIFGNGIIIAPVPIWRRRRKILAPTLSQKKVERFVDIFSEQSDVLVQKLKTCVGKNISIFNDIALYSMDVVSETNFGVKMGFQRNPTHPFLIAFEEVSTFVAAAIMQPWLTIKAVQKMTPIYNKFFRSVRQMRSTVEEVITAKCTELKLRGNGSDSNGVECNKFETFLEMLKKSSETNTEYNETELLEECLVITIAGTDTSAVASAFALMMMSRYPEIQEKVYNELFEVYGDSKRPVAADDLRNLKYLSAVIRESMRLYPPVPILVRKVEQDIVLPSGIKLVPGTGALIGSWGAHRNKAYWGEDADVFRPERFLEAPLKHPAQFIAFSYGPRNCPGYGYAMKSMKTSIAAILRQYRVLPAASNNNNKDIGDLKNGELRVKYDIMLKHVDNFKVVLQKRNN